MLISSFIKSEEVVYERPQDWIHEQKKSGKQFMLTETASQTIDDVAKKLGISRSEVIERAARCGGMEIAANFNPETGDCCQDTSIKNT
jgi:hypothetical protein